MGYTSGVYDILGECPDKDYAIRILRSIRQLDPDIVGTQFLQKTEVELISNVTKLIQKIDRLLGVFEEASKHVMEVGEDKRIVELADKLEELLNQNKNIAKGLIMLEQYVRTKSQFESPMQQRRI